MDKKDWISLKEQYPDMKETYCSSRSRGWLSEKVLIQTKNGAYFIAECARTRNFAWNTEKIKRRWKERFGEYKYQMLLDFHECDKAR